MEVTWPAGPEASSTICWTGGQLLGGIFIVASDALREEEETEGWPEGSMWRALVFMAVMAGAAVPCAVFLGRWGDGGRERRGEVDKSVVAGVEGGERPDGESRVGGESLEWERGA